MAYATPSLVSFNAGELSPKVDARADVDKYYSGCRTMENFIPLVEGGAMRMPGTYFVAETKDSSKTSRLMTFHFSTIQSYVLEFGEEYIRFYRDNGQIAVAYAAWVTLTVYAIGDLVTQAGSYYRCLVAHTAGTFATDLVAGYWVVSGGATDLAYEIVTPYQEADIMDLKFTQSADVMFIFHPSYPPKQLTRTGHTAWTLTDQVCKTGIEMNITNISQAATAVVSAAPVPSTLESGDTVYIASVVGMTEVNNLYFTVASVVNSVKTGAEMAITGITNANPAVVTCTSVPATLANDDWVYIKDVEGMTELNEGYYKVAAVGTGAGGTFQLVGIDSTNYNAYGAAGSAQEYTIGTFQLSGINSTAYTAYTSGGTSQETIYGTDDNNPSCGTFIEQRLTMGGTNNDPQKINMSASADYDVYTLDANDDSAGIEYTLVSDRVDRVYWMLALKFLVVGTSGGIWKISSSASGDPISSTNLSAEKAINFGSKNLDPEMVADALLWVTRSGRTVHQLGYSWETEKHIPIDRTRIAKHITLGETEAVSGISDMDFQKEPLPILWAVRNDGQLLGMTYETQENVYAWFRIVTEGLFESVAVISNDDEEDQTWVTVNRTIDGSTVRYIEYFKPISFYSVIEDCFFVHSGLSYDGGAAISVTSISLTDPCIAALAAGHGLTGDEKLKFSGTGTWLDEHIVTAHTVATNDITLWTEDDTSAIDSTDFDTYVSGGTVEVVQKTFSTLTHLEGEELDILADGAVHPRETVTTGSITLDYYANKVHAGLPYTATLEPMKLHAGSQIGSARGKKQKIHGLTVAFFESRGGKAGPDTDTLKSIPFGTGIQPTLFTGDVDFEFPGDWGNEATISIVQDQPLPMTIIGIIPRVTVNE